MAELSREAMERMGFAAVGEITARSERASLHNSAKTLIGNNTRIDDFCGISAGRGGITLGDHVRIRVGDGKIMARDFVGVWP